MAQINVCIDVQVFDLECINQCITMMNEIHMLPERKFSMINNLYNNNKPKRLKQYYTINMMNINNNNISMVDCYCEILYI